MLLTADVELTPSGNQVLHCDEPLKLLLGQRARSYARNLPLEHWPAAYSLRDPLTGQLLPDYWTPAARVLQEGRIDNALVMMAPLDAPTVLLNCSGQAVYDRAGEIVGARLQAEVVDPRLQRAGVRGGFDVECPCGSWQVRLLYGSHPRAVLQSIREHARGCVVAGASRVLATV